MVQAARSGVQNIAEGSQASATSKKTELRLTSVARASLEELRLDYEDFLRQRDLPAWPPGHPSLIRFKALRCSTLEDMRSLIAGERNIAGAKRNEHSSVLAANGALCLINLCCYLLDRQIDGLAKSFESNGGFTERLYRIRSEKRRGRGNRD